MEAALLRQSACDLRPPISGSRRHSFLAIPCLLVGTVALRPPQLPANVLGSSRAFPFLFRRGAQKDDVPVAPRRRAHFGSGIAAGVVVLMACIRRRRRRRRGSLNDEAAFGCSSTDKGRFPRVSSLSIALASVAEGADGPSKPLVVRGLGLGEVLNFVWPIVITSFASTMIGLVDSAFVGRCGGALQLAALAPATSLLEGLSYVLSFVAIGTLNVLAAATSDPDKEDKQRRLLARSLVVAGTVGFVVAFSVVVGAATAVRACGARDAMVPFAVSYARVRAIGIPFEMVFRVANAGLLSGKDSRTGLFIVVTQSVVNGLGDIVVCPKFGIVGAAITTVSSQCLGCLISLAVLWRRKLLAHFQAPAFREAFDFVISGLPLCLTLALKVSVVQMLNASASASGVNNAAAHQIAKSIFWVFSLMASESLSSTSQALLPGLLQGGERQGAARTLRLLLLLATLGAALTTGGLGYVIMSGGLGVFTSDEDVLSRVPIRALCIAVLATPFAFCLEGVQIAAQRQRWLSRRMLVLTVLAGVAFAYRPSNELALGWLWNTFAAYVVGRAAWYAWGVYGPRGVLAGGS